MNRFIKHLVKYLIIGASVASIAYSINDLLEDYETYKKENQGE